jgi:hypothetical protein
MVENTHKVDAGQWRKWDKKQRKLFNGVYEDILNVGPDLFLNPITVQRKLSEKEFQVIAWNAAWTAAYILQGDFTTEVITLLKDKVIAIAHVEDQFAPNA